MEELDCDPSWEIYSLRSDGTQVYMDGVCHWLCEEDYEEYEGYDYTCLVSFYLSNEEFFVTPIPSYEDDCFDTKASWINLAVL
jgi:molecular chaperone HtpG